MISRPDGRGAVSGVRTPRWASLGLRVGPVPIASRPSPALLARTALIPALVAGPPGRPPGRVVPVVPGAVATPGAVEEPCEVAEPPAVGQPAEPAETGQAAEARQRTAAQAGDEGLEHSRPQHALEHLVRAIGAALLAPGLEEPAVANVVTQLDRRDAAMLGGVVQRSVVLPQDLLAPPPAGLRLGGHGTIPSGLRPEAWSSLPQAARA